MAVFPGQGGGNAATLLASPPLRFSSAIGGAIDAPGTFSSGWHSGPQAFENRSPRLGTAVHRPLSRDQLTFPGSDPSAFGFPWPMTRDDRPERRLFEVFNRRVKLLTRRDDAMRGVPGDIPGDGGVRILSTAS
jgi:hypothetical protein